MTIPPSGSVHEVEPAVGPAGGHEPFHPLDAILAGLHGRWPEYERLIREAGTAGSINQPPIR